MHYLMALVIVVLLLWALKRSVVQRFKRKSQPPAPRQPSAFAVPVSKQRTAPYVMVALLSLAAGWFFRTSLFPEHQALEPSVEPTKRNSSGPEIRPLATATPMPEIPRINADGCEWVKPFSREDGTYVKGHWRSKPGYAGECSLPEPDPVLLPHEKALIYEGPRGGHYHYSKSGKKVYEHRR